MFDSQASRGHFLRGLAGAAVAGATMSAPLAQFADAATINLIGAGSTFDYPFFIKAFALYGHGVQINYQGIGSGGGIQQFTKNTVNFGATDVPMSASEVALAQKGGNTVLQVPVALGAVAIAYNLPTVKGFLKLDAATLSKMFLGTITYWDDPEIAKLNPMLMLPHLAMTSVHRSDASGTNYIMTDYLSTVSSEWASTIGKGKAVQWPNNSVGGKGNFGVAATIRNTPGAFGYVELAYAIQTHMTYAFLQNKAGKYTYPNIATARTAAAQFPHVSAAHFSIVNAPGVGSYPITGYSWVVVYKKQADATKGKALVDLLRWLTTDAGQKYAGQLYYVPLPKDVQQLATSTLNQVTV